MFFIVRKIMPSFCSSITGYGRSTMSKSFTTILSGVCFMVSFCCIVSSPAVGQTNAPAAHAGLEFIRVSNDGRGFAFAASGLKFTPWGFNYDHDRAGRLLETYWKEEWDVVPHDFEEMKKLGANTVRIHLQVSRFMKSAQEPNPESLQAACPSLAGGGEDGTLSGCHRFGVL